MVCSKLRSAFLFVTFLCIATGTSAALDNTDIALSPAAPATLGQPATLTAAVIDTTVPETTPTGGTVSFFDDNLLIGSATLTTGTATFSTSVLAAGSHTITARYNGVAGTFSPSPVSSSVTQNVTPRATKIDIALDSPSVSVRGLSAVTFTVTDTSASSDTRTGSSGTFTAGAKLLGTARFGHAAALLPNGNVLVAGGQDSTPAFFQTAELYDPGTKMFTATGMMTAVRTGHTATLLQNGTVLIVGGTPDGTAASALATAEIYDPIAGTFTAADATRADPAKCSAIARFGHTATLLPSGKVLIAGGQDATGTALTSTEIYDPATQKFSPGAPVLKFARFQHTATLLAGSKILMAGGNESGDAELVDPASATPTTTGSLASVRSGHTATLLPDGLVLIAGGAVTGTAVSTVELYSSLDGTFNSVSATMASERANATSTLLNDATVLVVGGMDRTPAALNTVDTYSPSYDPQGIVFLTSDNGNGALTGDDTRMGCTLALSGTGATGCTGSVTPKHVNGGTHNVTGHYLADWMANTAYALNAFILPGVFNHNAGGFIFQATVAGTSGDSAPIFPQTATQTVLDRGGPLTWKNVGLSGSGRIFSSHDHGSSDSESQELTVKSLAVTLTAQIHAKIYDGTANDQISPTAVPALLSGDTATQSYDSKSAGTRTLLANPTIKNGATDVSADYAVTIGPSARGTITPKTLTAEIIGNPTKVYEGNVNLTTLTPASFKLTGLVGSEVFAVTQTVGTFNSKDVAAANQVTASLAAGNFTSGGGAVASNYTLPTRASGAGHISKAHLTVTAEAKSKTYDGTVFSPFTAKLSGFVNSETDAGLRTALALSGNAAFSGTATTAKNAGTYSNGVVPELGTFTASNYDFPPTNFVKGTLTITKATMTAAIIGNPTKVYNGNLNLTTLTPANFKLTGLAGSEAFIVTQTLGTFNSKDVATANLVTASLAAGNFTAGGGAVASNYTLPTTASGAGAITKALLTVTATGVNRAYNGLTTAAVMLSDNRIGSDAVTENFSSASFADKNVGNDKTVSVSGISISGPNTGNYSLQNTTAGTKANITKASLTVSAAATNKVYDDSIAAAVTLSNNRVAGDAVTVSSNPAVFSDKNAGNDKTVTVTGISISGADASNYTANTMATTKANITPAPLTVKADAQSQIFGSAIPKLTATVSGFVAGQTLPNSGVIGSPSCTTTATPLSPVAAYPITCAKGALAAQNYAFTNFVAGTVMVTKADSISRVMALADSGNGAIYTFTARVINSKFAGTPTGSVIFKDEVKALGGGPADPSRIVLATVPLTNGTTTYTTAFNQLAAGKQHKITATYDGDGNFNAATGTNVVPITVTVAATVTTSPGTPIPPQTITIDNPAEEDVTYTTLTCAVLNALGQVVPHTNCAVNPASTLVVPKGQSANLTIQIGTSNGSSDAQPSGPVSMMRMRELNGLWLAMPAMFFLPLAGPTPNRKKWLHGKTVAWFGAVLLVALLLMSMGCGGGSFSNPNAIQPNSGAVNATPSGNYVVQVTAANQATGQAATGQAVNVASIPLQVGF